MSCGIPKTRLRSRCALWRRNRRAWCFWPLLALLGLDLSAALHLLVSAVFPPLPAPAPVPQVVLVESASALAASHDANCFCHRCAGPQACCCLSAPSAPSTTMRALCDEPLSALLLAKVPPVADLPTASVLPPPDAPEHFWPRRPLCAPRWRAEPPDQPPKLL